MGDELAKGDSAVEPGSASQCLRDGTADQMGDGDLLTRRLTQMGEIGLRLRRIDRQLAVDVAFVGRLPGRDRQFSAGRHLGHGFLLRPTSCQLCPIDDSHLFRFSLGRRGALQ